jgi:hypothetical protein
MRDGIPGIEELGAKVAEWRKRRRPAQPMPPDLWARAAGLAAEHGIAKVAAALRIDYSALKKRVNDMPVEIPSATPAVPSHAEFVEWLTPTSTAECSLELESAHGSRLRAQLRAVPGSELASIVREFAAVMR